MAESLRKLLESAIDYAGLFPPAKLPIESAASEFQSIINGAERWIVRRFVCPVAELENLVPFVPKAVDQPWEISALGTRVDQFDADLKLIEQFEIETGGRCLVSGFEVKASPKDVTKSNIRNIADGGFDEAFFELAWGDNMSECLHHLVSEEGVGAKARTGGLTKDLFPTVEQLANFVHECISLDLPFKCTAGLHHALPFDDQDIHVTHHGFLNVALGTALTLVHDLSRAELGEVLAMNMPSDFKIDDKKVQCRDWTLTVEDIEDSRDFFRSFGSCSVREPLDTLAELGFKHISPQK